MSMEKQKNEEVGNVTKMFKDLYHDYVNLMKALSIINEFRLSLSIYDKGLSCKAILLMLDTIFEDLEQKGYIQDDKLEYLEEIEKKWGCGDYGESES